MKALLSEPVNKLVEYINSNQDLIAIRDSIYKKWEEGLEIPTSLYFNGLLTEAKQSYLNKEIGGQWIKEMTMAQNLEFLDYFANNFQIERGKN